MWMKTKKKKTQIDHLGVGFSFSVFAVCHFFSFQSVIAFVKRWHFYILCNGEAVMECYHGCNQNT